MCVRGGSGGLFQGGRPGAVPGPAPVAVLLAARLRVASNKDSMNKTYQDLFEVRGSYYDGAMLRWMW